MKKGWTYKKLGDVGTFVRGGGFLKRDYVENGIPCIHYGQIHTVLGNVTTEHLTSISEELRSKTKFASKGDVIFAITSEDVEGSCKCTAWMGDYDVAVGGHAAIYKSSLNPAYVSYYAKSPVFYNAKKQYVHGFKVMEIKPADIAQIDIPVPSLDEQQRIVERLDAAFENIDKLKANAEKQLAEAQTLFQKSLAKAMEPKEGWEEKALGDVCTLSQGLAINSHTKHLFIQNGSLPLLRIKDMKEGTREIFVDEANCPQGCIASEEDIIYTRTGTLGLVFTGMHGVLHNNCFKIKHDINKLNKSFLIYFLRNDSFVKTIIGLASRAAQPDITHKLFKAQEIHFPPLAEQQRIVERLDALSENIRKYEEILRQIISECDALKQALLRKVFE